jgi:hypothetical protein
MTSQTSNNRYGWRRAVTGTAASSALAVGLLMGFSSQAALAEPVDPTAPADAPTTAQADAPTAMPAGDVLAVIAEKYMTGAGGGQISNWVKESLQLRALGFKPSKGNLEALQAGLDYLPNQVRLVDALKETVAYQRKIQAQMQNANSVPGGVTFGINQLPPGVPQDPTNPDNTGVFIGPNGGIQQPIGP